MVWAKYSLLEALDPAGKSDVRPPGASRPPGFGGHRFLRGPSGEGVQAGGVARTAFPGHPLAQRPDVLGLLGPNDLNKPGLEAEDLMLEVLLDVEGFVHLTP